MTIAITIMALTAIIPKLVIPTAMHTNPAKLHCQAKGFELQPPTQLPAIGEVIPEPIAPQTEGSMINQGFELQVDRDTMNGLKVLLKLPDGTTSDITKSVAQTTDWDDMYIMQLGKETIGLFDLGAGKAVLAGNEMECSLLGAR